MSNYASPPQLVEGVAYRGLDEMQGFAQEVEGRASRAVVHGREAFRVLHAHEAGRL